MMQLLLSLLLFVLAAVAAPRSAGQAGKFTTATIDDIDLGSRSELPGIVVPDNQCISSFYHDDAKKDMCGNSTVSSAMYPHCGQGTASLVDDCNALIQDLQGQDGGGFWGYSNESTTVVASNDTCTFSVTVHDDKALFNIGTQDVIDLISLALTTQGKCGDDESVAATGDTSCKAVDTNWLVSGPSQIWGGGGG
ncbi:hypothetical protein INS49_008703 [Diaporthe citri]|uniref:uncharacterized protein n=1 Tax=Diaporthe citri TaxID=83186 RepID=UPI001C80CB15|nr:uncharacterized protein INS49_008703 [Diaporthe citri]KAG6363602.1 hypothetical protein INS49_008703 [Diaporthe citri]